MKASKRAQELLVLRALAERFRGQLVAGAEWGGELAEDGLVAEVTVRIRRLVTADAARQHREGALAALRKDTFLIRHCGCEIKRRSAWGGSRPAICSGRIVAAVVFSSFSGENHYQFVCSRHREAYGVRRQSVLAVVDLPEAALRPIRAQDEINKRAWEAKCRAEDAAELARHEGKVP